MIETHCQDRQACKPSHKEEERQRPEEAFVRCKEERILFMDEIKVVPYIPDEDYDNPAIVIFKYFSIVDFLIFDAGSRPDFFRAFCGESIIGVVIAAAAIQTEPPSHIL